ncbi:unnamed protein product [Parnassius mnemosyne]
MVSEENRILVQDITLALFTRNNALHLRPEFRVDFVHACASDSSIVLLLLVITCWYYSCCYVFCFNNA